MITCKFEDNNKATLRHLTVGCVVVRDGKILLAKRNAKLLEGGKWCLLGGFAERDETMAEAVKREVLEESGWEIGELTLLRINDNPERRGEDRQNVDFIYFAEPVKKSGESDWETDELKWFGLNELPPRQTIAFDHIDSIELYNRHLHETFPLPVVGPTQITAN